MVVQRHGLVRSVRSGFTGLGLGLCLLQGLGNEWPLACLFFFSFADESVHHQIVHRSRLLEARHSHPN